MSSCYGSKTCFATRREEAIEKFDAGRVEAGVDLMFKVETRHAQ